MLPEPKAFASERIESWNPHDLERILSHYAGDVDITSPMIRVAMVIDDGTVCGKAAERRYWGAALQKMPDLHFELVEHTQGRGLHGDLLQVRHGQDGHRGDVLR